MASGAKTHAERQLQGRPIRTRRHRPAVGTEVLALAHELRAPLSVIRGYLSLIADGSLGEVPARWELPVARLDEKARELARLIEDLLTAARLDSGRLSTDRERLDVREAVAGAVSRSAGRAELLGARLEVQLPERPVTVQADPSQVALILDNLVNNSLSYSAGPPWVLVRAEAQHRQAVIAVEDHGIGVRSHMRERIFERFVRADDEAIPGLPGSGLGLAIARELAEGNGGTLVLERSAAGAGSRFVVRFPLASDEMAHASG
ncbi:MAG: HAMP domain-containing histidine kinase [Chloroflexi bacterium]|nr:MAG: HAMP domain-containing histidine kinase [Chloroflexota bacterium]